MPRPVPPEIQRAILDEVEADPKHYSVTKMARKYRVTKATVSRIILRGYVKIRIRLKRGSFVKNTRELDLDNDALDIDPISLKPRDYRRIRQAAEKFRRMLGPTTEDWSESSKIALDLSDDHLRNLREVRRHLVSNRLASEGVFEDG